MEVAETKVMRWVPVAERLPETPGRYLVYDGEQKLARVGELGGQGYDYFLCGFSVISQSHWMPLAEAPA